MCSWAHRVGGLPAGPLGRFEPKRPTKNIVYYADRVRELEGAPTLAYHSPHKGPAAKVLYNEIGGSAANATTLGIAAEEEELVDVHMQPIAPPRQTRKRKVSAIVASPVDKEVTAVIKVESGASAVKVRRARATKTTALVSK